MKKAAAGKVEIRTSDDEKAYDLAIESIRAAEHVSHCVAHRMLITMVGEIDGWEEPYQRDAVWESLTGVVASERLTMMYDQSGTLVFARANSPCHR